MSKTPTDDAIVILNWRGPHHPQAGGAELVCVRLAEAFAKDGKRVVYVTAASPKRKGLPEYDFRIVEAGGRYSVYLFAFFWLLRNRRHIGSIVDSQNGIPFFSPLAVHRKTPVVLLVHHVHQDQFSDYFKPSFARIARFLEGPVCRLVYGRRTVVVVSPSTRGTVRRRLRLKGDILIAPPGVDRDEECPGNVSGVSALFDRQRTADETIVSVGRLVPHKGVKDILSALPSVVRKVPQLTFHVVGDGPDRRSLEDHADGLGLRDNVVFHGAVPAAKRDALVRTSWLCVNGSHGEGWGLSVIEANGAGVPVLAYKRPGLRDSILDGETGWLLEEDETLSGSLTSVLEELRHPDTARAYSRRARAWHSSFTWDDMATQVRTAIAHERARLSSTSNRRSGNRDVASVVTLSAGLLSSEWADRLRTTDRAIRSTGILTLLLSGTDTQQAPDVLIRLGCDFADAHSSKVCIRVARPADHVQLGFSTAEAVFDVKDSETDCAV
jgi:glycosyltransferase involved in cell wall biosynthesis